MTPYQDALDPVVLHPQVNLPAGRLSRNEDATFGNLEDMASHGTRLSPHRRDERSNIHQNAITLVDVHLNILPLQTSDSRRSLVTVPRTWAAWLESLVPHPRVHSQTGLTMCTATARNVIGGPLVPAILAPRECILGSRHRLEFGIGPDAEGDVCKDCIDWEMIPGLGVASLLLKVGAFPEENERDPPCRECVSPNRLFARCIGILGLFLVNMVAGDEPLFRSASVDSNEPASRKFDHVLLGSLPVEASLGSGTIADCRSLG